MTFPLYIQWYKQLSVKYAIISHTHNREMMVISKHEPNKTTRMLKCHKTQHFDLIWKNMLGTEFNKTWYSIYYSLAEYKLGIPNQELMMIRDNDAWNKSHFDNMIRYTHVIDIDADTHELLFALDSAIKIVTKIGDCDVYFSGRGFHIYPKLDIPGTFNPEHNDNIYSRHYQIAYNLHHGISEQVDTSIYDSRRVIKCPFTLAVYPDDDKLYICKPVPDLLKFDLKDYILTDENFKENVALAKDYSMRRFKK